MKEIQKAQWVLRIAVAGEFLGHGVFGLQGKEQWVGWMVQLLGVSHEMGVQLLFFVGLLDILVALIVLVYPVRAVLLWATLWGFWTALLRPIVGEPVWDFIERFANWGAPLALLLLQGWPKNLKDWFKNIS
ncbi:MAG TPA: hypothetical protein VI588_00090 [Candidatus Gracilibacteria bacterium]|nr:hypothetical protein [Candidatus Gracilibacteria bacterium]